MEVGLRFFGGVDGMGCKEGGEGFYRLEVRCWWCDDVCCCVCICVEKGGNRGREGKGRKENRRGEEGRGGQTRKERGEEKREDKRDFTYV